MCQVRELLYFSSKDISCINNALTNWIDDHHIQDVQDKMAYFSHIIARSLEIQPKTGELNFKFTINSYCDTLSGLILNEIQP